MKPKRGEVVDRRYRQKKGERACVLCGAALPTGMRKYCGPACRHLVYMRCLPHYQREHVFKRDRGVCALCGWDLGLLKRALLHSRGHPPDWAAWRMTKGMVRQALGSIAWEMDHILAVRDGGGYREDWTADQILANLRTLCRPCHVARTRLQRAAWAKEKRKVGA